MTSIITFLNNNWIELLGYLASTLVGITFTMKTMIPLRRIAILSNFAFITYGYFQGAKPVLLLHLILLPLNIYRLYQMQKLVHDVKEASTKEFSFEWLVKYMQKEEFEANESLFKKGDEADKFYLIAEGKILLPEVNIELNKGEVFGELGIFSRFQKRTATAITKTHTTLYSITNEKMLELYYQNPKFGMYLIKLLGDRCTRNIETICGRN